MGGWDGWLDGWDRWLGWMVEIYGWGGWLRWMVGMDGWDGWLGWSFADWDCQPGKGMRGPEVSRTLHTRDFYLELDQERYGWVQSLE